MGIGQEKPDLVVIAGDYVNHDLTVVNPMLSILKKLEMEVTEAEIADDAYSYAGGTEAWYLARAIRSRGFKARFVFKAGFTPEEGLPAIVGVRLGSIGHFIAIIEEKDGIFVVGDPMRGREEVSREELEERYEFTDFQMHITTDS